MKEIKLSNGFKFEMEDDALDNMELVDAIAEMEEENPLVVSRLASLLYGDLKKSLYDSLRENGKVPVTSVVNAIKETFEQLGEKAKK